MCLGRNQLIVFGVKEMLPAKKKHTGKTTWKLIYGPSRAFSTAEILETEVMSSVNLIR